MQRAYYLGLLRLLKEPRRCLEGEEKWRVQARSDHKCVLCGDICQGVYDHKVRVTQLGGQEECDFDYLCSSCHSNKTNEEPQSQWESDYLASHVNADVKRDGDSPPIPPLVLKVNLMEELPPNAWICDVVK